MLTLNANAANQSRTSGTGLINVYSSRNLGDAAIMSALGQLHPSGHVSAMRNATAQELDVRALVWTDDTKKCGKFISVGGDIFNNARPDFVTRAFLGNVWQLHKHCRNTILFGQTIPGSCRGPALRLLASVLRRLPAVVVRDQASFLELRARNVAVKLSFDAAFALQPTNIGIRAARSLFDAAGLDPDQTALLSVRSFDALYPHDHDLFVERLAQLANALRARGHQVAIPIQSDVSANDTDRHLATELASRCPAVSVLDLFEPARDAADHVERLLGVMAIANIVVGLRYHATVLRLAAGRMAYNLSYSRKGEDLAARLRLCGTRLDTFDPEEEVAAIEATATRGFQVEEIRNDVRESFARAYGSLQ